MSIIDFYSISYVYSNFVQNPIAYEALKSFNILQLPSHSILQSYNGAFLHEAGDLQEAILK